MIIFENQFWSLIRQLIYEKLRMQDRGLLTIDITNAIHIHTDYETISKHHYGQHI